MNARTIRRSIERKQLREAKKQSQKQVVQALAAIATPAERAALAAERESLTLEYETQKATLAQLQANRRNAQLSTGPTTETGKSTSSRNALKTGLTGRTVLLPSDDAARYENHIQSYFHDLKPLGDQETELAQSIADSKWRLARIPGLEFGLYTLGRIEFAEEFQNLPKAEAAALIEAKTFLAYQRQLNNLSIQESRLRRQCEKDIAELTRLQQLRAAAAETARKTAANATAISKPQPIPNKIGFEFANPLLEPSETSLDLATDPLTRPQAA